MVEFAFVVLALADSIYNGVDGGESFCCGSFGVLYGVVLLMAAIAYYVLQQRIIAAEGERSILKKAIGKDWKGKLSPCVYAVAIAVAFWDSRISQALYVGVALIWLVPDRRIERVLQSGD